MKKKVFRNGKGNYMGLKAGQGLKVNDVKSAYTAQSLMACGIAALKGKEFRATGRAIDKGMISALIGSSAVNHWLNTRGWLKVTGQGIALSADGVNALNARYAATAPAYNTNIKALRIVGHAMRTGDESGIGYNGQPFEIES